LGEAPAHWVVTKLGRFARLRGGFAFSADDFGDEGIQIVRMNNLKRGVLDLSSSVRVPNEKFVESVNLNVGDLVWGMSGSIGETGSLGNFARIREENLPCLLNQRVGRFDAEPSGLSLDFLEQLIQTQYFYEQIIVLVTGTAQFNISSDQVQSCIVALPPVEEQVLIVAHLAEQATSFDELIFTAQQSIDFLSERRSALISAAVTGQIDIRGECNVFKS
jgi:type I restriction enzyme S subunit